MKQIEEIIKKEVNQDHQYVVELRRYLHIHPELSKKEFETAKFIENELDKIGISHIRVGQTGVIGYIKGEKSESNDSIILRADIDALPIQEVSEKEYKSINNGVMHACGHDAHTAGLIGAARILVKHKKEFSGTIKLHFQPGEEVGFGARDFINRDYLKKNESSRSFGIHLASNIQVGKIALVSGANNAAVDWFKIEVNGKGCHVSTPEKGVDSIYVASQILIGIQSLITRKENPMENILIGVGKIVGGNAYNVVAQQTYLEGTIRTLDENIRKKVKEDLVNLAKLTAQIYGASVTISFNDNTSALINDEQVTNETIKVATRLFGKENVITKRQPSLGGDDFAEYINLVKGCYGYVGSGNVTKSQTRLAHHDQSFDIDEDCLYTSVEILATYAIEYLNKDID